MIPFCVIFTDRHNISEQVISEFNKSKINRIILKKYPKTDDRSFRSQWFDLFKWLECCPEKDTCFCYPCRVFGTTESKETTFIKTGFCQWKKALDKQKGFYKHDSSQVHKICMSK